MAKDTRLQFRVSAAKKARAEKCAAIVGMDLTALGEAAIDALCDYIEARGEITMPLAVLPRNAVPEKSRVPTAPSPASRITYLSDPDENTARAAEDPPPPKSPGPARRPKAKGTRAN